jgi:hypothetical protein
VSEGRIGGVRGVRGVCCVVARGAEVAGWKGVRGGG